jgi:hypothetical protein
MARGVAAENCYQSSDDIKASHSFFEVQQGRDFRGDCCSLESGLTREKNSALNVLAFKIFMLYDDCQLKITICRRHTMNAVTPFCTFF